MVYWLRGTAEGAIEGIVNQIRLPTDAGSYRPVGCVLSNERTSVGICVGGASQGNK